MRDLSHRVLSWNKGAERLYGWTEAEAMGKSTTDLFGVTLDDRGTRAFVANVQSSDVSVVDLSSARVTGTLPVGSFPYAIAHEPGAERQRDVPRERADVGAFGDGGGEGDFLNVVIPANAGIQGLCNRRWRQISADFQPATDN